MNDKPLSRSRSSLRWRLVLPLSLALCAISLVTVASVWWGQSVATRSIHDTLQSSLTAELSTQRTSLDAQARVACTAAELSLRTKIEGLTVFLSELIPGAMIAFDTVAIDAYCESLAKDPDILCAVVLEPNATPRSLFLPPKAKERFKTDKPSDILAATQAGSSDTMVIRRDVVAEGKVIGSVVVVGLTTRLRQADKDLVSAYSHMTEESTTRLAGMQTGITQSLARASTRQQVLLGVVSVVGILCGILLVWRLAGSITKPIIRVASVLQSLAQGHLSQRVAIVRNDEVGAMAAALDNSLNSLSSQIAEIHRTADTVATSAQHLTQVSKEMTSNATLVSTQANSAAQATGSVSQNISSSAAGIEEMTASVEEIAKNADQAAGVAQEGVSAANAASTAMSKLVTSSVEIGDIIKLISTIAQQTNLLALNATIEAARAGEAGRGFAVVAAEVKELSRKTGEATGEISQKVTGIQSETRIAQESIVRIREIVERINALQGSIASAVEEQAATAKELAATLGQVSSTGTTIATNVAAVATAAGQSSHGAADTLAAAQDLVQLAADLKLTVARFTE